MFSDFFDHRTRSRNRAPQDGIDVGQWEWELETLTDIYRFNRPMVTVELGVWQGGTLRRWLDYAPPGALVIGIDTLELPEHVTQWAATSPAQFEYIQGDTHATETLGRLAALLNGRKIDFLFIDADHTEAGAAADFDNYGRMVQLGGIIALHDILDPAPSRNQDHIRVSRLWQRIQRAGYVTRELVAHPEQEWGGIGVVMR